MQEILHTPWMAWTAAAGVVTGVALAAALLGAWRRINTEAFITQIKKLVVANNPARAVRLCNAVPGTRAARLTLTILGLELPARGGAPDQDARGYREGAPTPDFAEALRLRVEAERAALQREVHWLYGVVLALMAAALATGVVALSTYLRTGYLGLHTIHYWPFIVTLVPLLGLALTIRTWRLEHRGLGLVQRTLLPLLRPAEEMDDERREAAAKARAIYPGRSS